MKRISVSKSAFFNPRALISFSLCSIGLVLAVLVFTAFPSSTARATPSTCEDVTFEEHQYTYNGTIFVKFDTVTEGCIIFYKSSATYPGCPTHSGATPTGGSGIYNQSPSFPGLGVSYPSSRHFTAIAYKASATPTEDSACTSTYVYNDNP